MTTSLVMFLSLATAATTMMGGLLAIALQGRLPLVLGFSAGAVIGVAFFDLLPEAVAVGKGYQDARALMGFAALGFFLYAALDRLAAQHGRGGVPAPARGLIGAASFSVHSLLDGLMMGIAFRTGREIGLVVAAAVLAHDFSDGLNTVNIVTKNGGTRGRALSWLLLDAVAPVIGAALSLLIAPPRNLTGVLLALFGGFFLYIGAADLLPASLRARPRPGTIIAIFMGAGVLWLATKLA
ncbi:MAG TPA: ZIP family metal transporter [Rhizomicrobium sp.]|jgi:ZIP family zinc transporter|nr:ZIP family metal transporter [Rhizomicrobium sp.]